MHTRSRNLLTVSMVALLATLGAGAAQAKLATNGVQTNGHQVEGGAAKAPIPGTPVTPQATTVTLPKGTTLQVR